MKNTLTGTYVRAIVMTDGSLAYILEVEGKNMGLIGNSQLDPLMARISKGRMVKIHYSGNSYTIVSAVA